MGQSRRVPVPDLTEGEKLIAAFAAGGAKELSDIRQGVLWLPDGTERPQEVWFFISSRTGQMVKRAAYGAEGFVLDHYDRSAVDTYLNKVAGPLMAALGPNLPHAAFCDSLEVYGGDWTGDFLAEFHRRRGYDLRPRLPALVADLGPETAAIRHDWGQTLTELLEERFLAPLKAWTQARGTLFRIQGYGIPPATLSSNAFADLPEGEGHQWKRLSASRWAASASHLHGRPVASSETWTWLHSPVFRATPLDLKAEADRHFLQGITQLIGHGWPYTPPGADYPGWRIYASGVFNDRNPWWIAMPDVSLYLQRLSFLLREGKPANDVALYLPVSDARARFSPGRVNLFEALGERLGPDVVARVIESGFGLDFIDDGALGRGARVEKGTLILGENRYRVVVLPGVTTIPPATLRKLAEFADAGGILIATRRLPDTAPGLHAGEPEKREVGETARRLFQAQGAPARFVEDEARLTSTLVGLLTPDVALSPAAPEIGFIRRTTGFAEVYFLANTANVTQKTRATFRVDGLEPEWWDPMTGKTRPARVAQRGPGSVSLSLELEPYGSRVLVFSKGSAAAPESDGPVRPAMDLSTGWRVTFGENGPGVAMESLRSWTEEESTRYYSGVATYEKEFSLPEGFLQKGVRVQLDFGEVKPLPPAGPPSSRTHGMQALLDAPVREAAVITLNGRRAGSVWCPPYALDVTDFLKTGPNHLRIVVGNLAVNHMAGRPLPDYKLLNLRYGVRFEAQDMDKLQPVPSGLLGPIRLLSGSGLLNSPHLR